MAGYPPFCAETVTEIFENLLRGNIQWPDECTGSEGITFSSAARDLISRLLSIDLEERLGQAGSAKIKEHEFFAGVDWDALLDEDAAFVPT